MNKLAALVVCLTATAAHAESHAWTTAKKTLPGGLQAVVGVNIAPIKASALYQQLVPMAMAKAGTAKDNLDKLKATCGIDAMGMLDSVVLGLTTDEKAVIIVQLKGTNQKALETCGQKVAKSEGKTLAISKDGAITKYTGMGDDDAYVKWLSKDSLAIAQDKDTLTKLTAGGIAKDAVGTEVGKLSTDAALWGVVNKSQDIPDLGGKMTSAYGTLDLKSGSLAADVHLIMDSAKTATTGATQAQQQLDGIKKSGQVPKQFAAAVDSITVKAAGAELVLGGHVSEADLAAMAGMLSALANH